VGNLRQQVASALLGSVETPAARNFLFRQASAASAAASGPAISTDVAMSYYKGSLAHVLAIAANPNTDPHVLSTFSKDGRVSVRNTLLKNPALPHPDRVKLIHWAVLRRADDDLTSLGRLTANELVNLLDRADAEDTDVRVRHRPTIRAVAETLAADASAASRIQLQRMPYVLQELAQCIVDGRADRKLRLTKLLAETRALEVRDALQVAVQAQTALTADLATAWREQLPPGRSALNVPGPAGLVEPEAIDILADGKFDHQLAAMINGLDEATIRHKLTSLPDDCSAEWPEVTVFDTIAAVLHAFAHRQFSPATEQLTLRRFVELGGSAVTHKLPGNTIMARDAVLHLLNCSASALPDELLVRALRNGSMQVTNTWLQWDGHRNGPRASVLDALGADAGWATTIPYPGQQHEGSPPAADWPALSDWLLRASRSDPSLVTPVSHLLGNTLVRELPTTGWAAVIGPQITQRLGDDADAWEVFLTLCEDWTGGLHELLDAVPALLGREPVAAAAPASQAAHVTTVAQQLTVD